MENIHENTEIKEQCDTSDTQGAELLPVGGERKYNKFAILCLVSLMCAGVLAVLRSLILFGDYDNKICLYPNGALNTALMTCTVVFFVLLSALAFISLRGEGKYKINYGSVGMIFSQSLASFSFAALAFSIIVITKKEEMSLGVFDSVLIALSLVAAVSFFSDAFAKKETLGVDASVVLKLFSSICCLFVTFYFYFDKTTAIHNTNKKFATLAFVAALLTTLYAAKAYVGRVNKIVFASANMLCVCYSVAYAVPNLVWYFKASSPLLINVFFDVVSLALAIVSAMTLLCFERAEDATLQTEDCAADDSEDSNTEEDADSTPNEAEEE